VSEQQIIPGIIPPLVNYVLSSGRNQGHIRPALVVHDWGNGRVNLQVLTDGPNDFEPNQIGYHGFLWATSVPYNNEAHNPHTWHLIEQPQKTDEVPIQQSDIVRYVAYNKQDLKAILIAELDGKADLAVLTNLPNAAGVKTLGLQFHQDVKYSDMNEPGTWHR
jgi:hypothetical protein